MSTGSTRGRAAAAAVFALLVGLASLGAGCRRDARPGGEQVAAQAGATPQGGASLDSEIERLERQAERNPADSETRDELARVYVRRGNARSAAGQVREALADYQSALRNDPDNNEAQAAAANAAQQLGGGAQQEDENGAPVPPPISPNVSGEGEQATPTTTPKSREP